MNNESILKEFMQRVWNEKDFASVAKYVDESYTIYHDTGDPWEGKTLNNEEYKTRLNYSFNSFPDMHFAIQSAVADGDFVGITWIMTGTNLGKIGEIPATGKPINTHGITIYHFHNGKVCGHTQVFDRTTVMKQLGFA
ncbi:MAG: ester cyclase [Sphingobacteriales bacterium]